MRQDMTCACVWLVLVGATLTAGKANPQPSSVPTSDTYTQHSPAQNDYSDGVVIANNALPDEVFPAPSSSSEACNEEVVTGPCRALFERWAYDQQTSSCRPFIYGGCAGSRNNFLSRGQCEKQCAPQVPRGARCYEEAACPRFCSKIFYPGVECASCQCPEVTENDSYLCQLPLDGGVCRAYFKTYGFDTSTGKCRLFVYGGCGGNRNRFGTMELCRATCPDNEQSLTAA